MQTRKTIMRRTALFLLGSVLLFSILSCSDDRARALRPAREGEKDYREMLTLVRDRRKAKDDLALLRSGIEDCQVKFGRLPSNLVELVRFGCVDHIPEPPEGAAYAYDPVRGRVDLIRQDGKQPPPKQKRR
ncbi:MAG: hypothetical protein EOM20_04800 [Spartobacteria bacterium]|nr:hypothetical protein [Spartobacteria bacterium]